MSTREIVFGAMFSLLHAASLDAREVRFDLPEGAWLEKEILLAEEGLGRGQGGGSLLNTASEPKGEVRESHGEESGEFQY